VDTRKTVAQGWVPNRHGIPSSYVRGCRCTECTAANNARCRKSNKAHRDRNRAGLVEIDGRMVFPNPPSGHGKASTYRSYGCRCDACREANSTYKNSWKQQRGASR
jgi:hypothetical protein